MCALASANKWLDIGMFAASAWLATCSQPVTPTAHWLEFLDFARVILTHPAEIIDGTVTARGPGLGLEWNEAAVAKYMIA